ncbi:MAG: sigma-70 family RNA polymerase sigma factor [Myxococcota bacterium]
MAHEEDRFVEEFRPFVLRIVQRVRSELAIPHVDTDELLAFGFQGLLEARSRYDPSRGVQFNTYAYYRVRGAVIDGLRKMIRGPRGRFTAAAAKDRICEDTAIALGQTPGTRTGREAAGALGNALSKITSAFVLAHTEVKPPEPSPESVLLTTEEQGRVRDAVAALGERERALVRGFYFEGRRFDEVAAELGISKSWASRLHSKALRELRELLGDET